MVFSLILKTFQCLTNWSNDMQQQKQQQQCSSLFIAPCWLHVAVRTCWDWTGQDRGVTKTLRLSTVPVSGPDTGQCDVGNIPHKNTHFTDIYGVL